jgi:hypothetical protein
MALMEFMYPITKHVALEENRLLVSSGSQGEMRPGLADGAGSWSCSPAVEGLSLATLHQSLRDGSYGEDAGGCAFSRSGSAKIAREGFTPAQRVPGLQH